MAIPHQQGSAQERIGRHLLGTVNDALALVQRFREVDGFRRYVRRRLRLVVPALALILLTGFACAMAVVMLLVRPLALVMQNLITNQALPCCKVEAVPGLTYAFSDCNFEEHVLEPSVPMMVNPDESCGCQGGILMATRTSTWGGVKAMYR